MVFTTTSWRQGQLSEIDDVQFTFFFVTVNCQVTAVIQKSDLLKKCHEEYFFINSLLIFFFSFCRVRLSKRRAKAGSQSTTNAVLVCKHRDMNEKELEAQVSRASI